MPNKRKKINDLGAGLKQNTGPGKPKS